MQYWATVLSPIVGVIAIIVALVVASRSSRDAEKQIKAIYNLLDVFMAAQNPNMMVTKNQYERQLEQLDDQIQEAKAEMEIVNPFFGRGPRIEDVEYLEEKKQQKQHLENLYRKRSEIEIQLHMIQSYLDKTKK